MGGWGKKELYVLIVNGAVLEQIVLDGPTHAATVLLATNTCTANLTYLSIFRFISYLPSNTEGFPR